MNISRREWFAAAVAGIIGAGVQKTQVYFGTTRTTASGIESAPYVFDDMIIDERLLLGELVLTRNPTDAETQIK